MEFNKYQHVERLGTVETENIEIGECWLFPKLDGSNGQVWVNDNGKICCGSRNRELTLENDNQGFMAWVLEQDNIREFFSNYQNLRLFGEWLIPHTLRTYEQSAWKKFYVFDVMDANGNYLPYEVYKTILDAYDIEYIPPICKIRNPTVERIVNQLEKNVYLIEDGKGAGEGIVIKNYSYRNKYGRQTWAKVVRNEFKAKHSKSQVTEVKEKIGVESAIVDKYVTESLVTKEFAKIENENGGWSSKMIPRLLNTVYYCLVKEESWNFIKENKNPKIDFKRLMTLSFQKTKELKPELF